MTISDQFMMALTAWRENRGGLTPGMQSVINVIVNRSRRHNTTPYFECVRKLQFSSVTAPGNPELNLWAMEQDPQWINALGMAASAASGVLPDITTGSIDYYAPGGLRDEDRDLRDYEMPNGVSVPFPKRWDRSKLTFEAEIAGQLFFRES
jgi:hypothetical protein